MKGITENLEGLQFGEWTIIEKLNKKSGGHYIYKCIHTSGYIREMASNDIKRGDLEKTRAINKNNKQRLKTENKNNKFNSVKKRLNSIYWNMRQRCENQSTKSYKNYGARNIKVCNEWKDSFDNFYIWAMNNGYQEGLTIDRIDVNGNYEPNNCRWATNKEQQNNRRNNINIQVNDTILTLQQWADSLNISRDRLLYYYEKSYMTCVEYINQLTSP